jgi:hypothetical protein
VPVVVGVLVGRVLVVVDMVMVLVVVDTVVVLVLTVVCGVRNVRILRRKRRE